MFARTNTISLVRMFTLLAVCSALGVANFAQPSHAQPAEPIGSGESEIGIEEDDPTSDRPHLVAGDVDQNNRVDFDDFFLIVTQWGRCPERACDADLNGDYVIDIDDLAIVLTNWQ